MPLFTLLFLKNSDTDLNGQIKSKSAARMILLTILVDTVITVNILNWMNCI